MHTEHGCIKVLEVYFGYKKSEAIQAIDGFRRTDYTSVVSL